MLKTCPDVASRRRGRWRDCDLCYLYHIFRAGVHERAAKISSDSDQPETGEHNCGGSRGSPRPLVTDDWNGVNLSCGSGDDAHLHHKSKLFLGDFGDVNNTPGGGTLDVKEGLAGTCKQYRGRVCKPRLPNDTTTKRFKRENPRGEESCELCCGETGQACDNLLNRPPGSRWTTQVAAKFTNTVRPSLPELCGKVESDAKTNQMSTPLKKNRKASVTTRIARPSPLTSFTPLEPKSDVASAVAARKNSPEEPRQPSKGPGGGFGREREQTIFNKGLTSYS
ncbi:hypothetical protein RRG08_043069 [Elysia crispata]|uniref:Uncharacterized protein n=1 Tax=Elysia crispata TaxID=231223 RepID=A0AAE0XY63_9GAST|nr:hypothetical protein RRG08_043069 [Elysia crispata]